MITLVVLYLVCIFVIDMILAFPSGIKGALGFIVFVFVAVGPLALIQILTGH